MAREFLTNINLNKNELQNAAIQNLAVAPSSPVVGQIYFDTILNNIRNWDGTQWLDYVTAESGGGYITSTTTDFTVTTGELAINYSNLESALTGDGFATTTDISTAISTAASNYDAAGAASSAESNAKSYTDLLIGDGTVDGSSGNTVTDRIESAISGLAPNYITSVGGNLDVTAGELTLGSNVIIANATQTLTSKTLDDVIVTGTTSFRNDSNVEGLTIDVSGIGTAHLIASDDLSLRATNDIVLYPGNDAGGHTGKAYIHWGNDATSAHPEREIATVGTSQTFSNKQFSDSIVFNDGVNANSFVNFVSGSLEVIGGDALTLKSNGADVTLQPDGQATVWGDQIVTANATQTISYKTLGAGTLLGANLDAANTYTITGLATPTSAQDAATKAYVDASAQGLIVQKSVSVASNNDIDLTSGPWAYNDLVATFGPGNYRIFPKIHKDGTYNYDIGVIRILLLGQTTAIGIGGQLGQGNGILTLTQISGTDNYGIESFDVNNDTFNLSDDFIAGERGYYVLVESGTHIAQGWICTGRNNETGLEWTQFSAAGEYTAGNGIDITANAISVKIDGDTLSETSSGLKANLYTNGGLDTFGGLYVKTANGVMIDEGGYVTIDTTVVARKYSESNGTLTASGGLVTWPVTHGLGTRNVTVQVFDLDTYEQVEVDVTRTSNTVATLSWVSAGVSADAYQVVVVG